MAASGVSQEKWEGRLVVLAITYDETRPCCSIDLHHGQEYLSSVLMHTMTAIRTRLRSYHDKVRGCLLELGPFS